MNECKCETPRAVEPKEIRLSDAIELLENQQAEILACVNEVNFRYSVVEPVMGIERKNNESYSSRLTKLLDVNNMVLDRLRLFLDSF